MIRNQTYNEFACEAIDAIDENEQEFHEDVIPFTVGGKDVEGVEEEFEYCSEELLSVASS